MKKKALLRRLAIALVFVVTLSLITGCGGPTVQDTFNDLFVKEDTTDDKDVNSNKNDDTTDSVGMYALYPTTFRQCITVS